MITTLLCLATLAPKPDFVFMHVNVLPMDHEHVLFDKDVLINNKEILDIVDGDKYTSPKGVATVDGHGKDYLMPGLSDMHCHVYFTDDFTYFLGNGVTTIRNMDGRPKHLTWRKQLAAGTLIGPRMLTAGPIISGPANNDGHLQLKTYEDGVNAVLSQHKAGYDFIKVYDGLPAVAYSGVIATARKLKMPVAGHIPKEEGLDGVLRARQDSIEHAEQIAYHTTLRDYDFSACDSIAKQIKAAGSTVCPTVNTIYCLVELAKEPGKVWTSPTAKYIHPEVAKYWKSQQRDTYAENELLILWQGRMVKALSRAGVPIISGTDTFLYGELPGFSLHDELRRLFDYGLTPYQVLETSTANAGRYLKLPVGQIKRGYSADILLLQDDPLEDLGNLKKQVGVMSRGRWYTHEFLQQKMDDLAAGYAKGR
jgi:imidazolonepropionase-like amidohydrolase